MDVIGPLVVKIKVSWN